MNYKISRRLTHRLYQPLIFAIIIKIAVPIQYKLTNFGTLIEFYIYFQN